MNWSDLTDPLTNGGTTTLLVAACAWLLSVILGLALALVKESGPRPVGRMIDFGGVLLRGSPQLVVAYLAYFGLIQTGLQLSPLQAAIIAIGATEAGFVADYFRGAFLSVSRAQRDVGRALGFSNLQCTAFVVLPQTIRYMVPPLLNAFVALLKVATIASAIGVPEVLYEAQTEISASGRIVAISVGLLGAYLIFTVPLNRLVVWLQHRMQRRPDALLEADQLWSG